MKKKEKTEKTALPNLRDTEDEPLRTTSEPPYDGFFTSSVASANDSTGYAVTVPETEEAARELSVLGKNPNTESKKQKRALQKDGGAPS